MSKNIIDAIDNFSESLKGENVDSMNLVQAIDNLSNIIDGNASQIVPSGGGNSNWDLSDRIAKGSNGSYDIDGSVVIGMLNGQMACSATGTYSVAEGMETTASGNACHAEGLSSTASGQSSHAEGRGTAAIGDNSHADGNYTKANGKSQHVFGEFNVEEVVSAPNVRGTYVEIVGNGTLGNPSNARTLDWNGNETLAGSLTLGNTTITEVQLQALLALLN